MSRTVLGLDTSNYRTSIALVSEEGKVLLKRYSRISGCFPRQKKRCGRQQEKP